MNIKIHPKFFFSLIVTLLILLLFSGILFKTLMKPFKKPDLQTVPTITQSGDIYIPQDADMEQLITQTKKDLAQRLDIAPADVKVLQTQKKNWPDTSLGCPVPGKVYAQVITPGFLIVLGASGRNYNYHANLKEFVFCQ